MISLAVVRPVCENPASESPSEFDLAAFDRDGYVVGRSLVHEDLLDRLQGVAARLLETRPRPVEFEADLGYPGSPRNRQDRGGSTPRRLLQVIQAVPEIRAWATSTVMAGWIRALLGANKVAVATAHHNCLMTKLPKFSSRTRWHQDIRYWSFERTELVTAWLALGHENRRNGGLTVVPGTHQADFTPECFDERLFLQRDFDDAESEFRRPKDVDLGPGDVLFFHCRLVHSARSNGTHEPKLSLVFSYHPMSNLPIPSSRSASADSIELP